MGPGAEDYWGLVEHVKGASTSRMVLQVHLIIEAGDFVGCMMKLKSSLLGAMRL